jgi:uncharacterized DUF497 family protein
METLNGTRTRATVACVGGGFDFKFVSEMLARGLYSIAIDGRHGYDEVRWIAVGYRDGIALKVVFTESLRTRMISARPAASWEQDEYAKEFGA